MRNIREYSYPGEVWPVNPNRENIYGAKCYPRVAALPEAPETAVLITNPARAVAAARELVERGTRRLVVVSDGFRETATAEGIARESALSELAAQSGAQLIGPNCVGFASFHDACCAIAEPIPLGIQPGPVSVISQSGVLTNAALTALHDEQLGIDVCYSLGNGASFGLARSLRSVAERPATTTVCAVVENLGVDGALAAAVSAGRAAGVEFLFLLLGQSDDGKRVAQSHTGAVVGDQRVMRAWLEDLGVILADSFEELARAASLLTTVGRPGPDRGVFVLSVSGGAAGLAADTAARCGLPLARVSPQTEAALKQHLLPGTTVGNPLDVTTHGGPDSVRAIYELVAADPAVGILLDPYGMSWPDDSYERRWHRGTFDRMAAAVAESGVSLIITNLVSQPETDYMRRLAKADNVVVNIGTTVTLNALAKLYVHSGVAPAEQPAPAAPKAAATAASVVDELRARAILSEAGFPVVPGAHVPTPAAAAAATEGLRAPWVAKLSLAGLGHKGRVGGVRLGLCRTEEVEQACQEISDRVASLGVADPDDVSFMIQQMEFGPELLVSAVRDRVAGPSLIVGVGGWAAETGTLFAVIPLPAGREVIGRRLRESGLPHLLDADKVDGLARLLDALGTAFTAGQLAGYAEVECNPVIVGSAGPVIADALLIQK
jgi:acyl-CoA synthetase (NDP forming)